MPRPTDPTSTRQVQARAHRMKSGTWTQQTFGNLANAILQTARWHVWEKQGGTPGPDDSKGSWPRLPDKPGEKIQLGIIKLDMGSPESWATARELLEGIDWKGRAADRGFETVEALAQRLAEDLEHSPLLGHGFYNRHSHRAGEMLTTEQRTLPVTVLGGTYQSLWQTPKHPLGLCRLRATLGALHQRLLSMSP